MTLEDRILIKALKSQIYDLVKVTPFQKAEQLSSDFENNIFLKREDLQDVFSFKIRGAYQKILSLTDSEKKQGLIASSAGNHAQGVAKVAKELKINATIVMPLTTPNIKVNAVRGFGAKVILHGDNYDEAYRHAQELMQASQLTFIPPYDDEEVITGQATIALEILQQIQHNDLDAIFIPVGGGGLIAGVATILKKVAGEIKVISVEPDDAASMQQALLSKKPVTLAHVGSFADGVSVKQVGNVTFSLAQKYVDSAITVSSDEICAAIKDIFSDTRVMVEPSGAVALAGVKKYIKENGVKQKNFAVILSGANLNFDRLKYIVESTEVSENKEVLLGVEINEKPGEFLKLCRLIGKQAISEFNYRFSGDAVAKVFVGLKLSNNKQNKELLLEKLKQAKFNFCDLSFDALAKLHIRHMIGGKALIDSNLEEQIYSVNFPERAGALLEFLEAVAVSCNISLFHYRNHGDVFGRVLLGVQLPKSDSAAKDKFNSLLKTLQYEFESMTDNEAYRLFLA